MARDTNDIKAPDGYLLGGYRRVRKDGTILFHRMYWVAPPEWIGEMVWVHVTDGMSLESIEAARPGLHIFEAQGMASNSIVGQVADPTACIELFPNDRPDAKTGWRNPAMKAWAARSNSAALSPKNTESE